MFVLEVVLGAPPQAEKSEAMGMEGGFAGAAAAAFGCGAEGGGAGVGSGVAHALSEPHGSLLEKFDSGFEIDGLFVV